MNKISTFLVFLFVFLLLACGSADVPGGDTEPGNNDRPTAPSEYAGLRNPYEDAAAVEAGRKIYQSNCSSCHGNHGKGDGAAARSLDPAPSDLAAVQAIFGDDYLLWRISEGGLVEPFRSSMPAWKTILSQDQIWELIAFIRALEN